MVDAGQIELLFQVQPGAQQSSTFKMESKADCKTEFLRVRRILKQDCSIQFGVMEGGV